MKTDHSHKNELDKRAMKLIASFTRKGRLINIYKNARLKYFVWNNGRITQRELTSEAIVQYLAHVANDE